jgi:hypothetical protein
VSVIELPASAVREDHLGLIAASHRVRGRLVDVEQGGPFIVPINTPGWKAGAPVPERLTTHLLLRTGPGPAGLTHVWLEADAAIELDLASKPVPR